ncbi:hypothetical protein A2U01_0055841, partial [Trifolium medium]|nr:hypothetical protein [Trifolium medium]
NFWSNKRLQHPGSAHLEAYVPEALLQSPDLRGRTFRVCLLLPESDLVEGFFRDVYSAFALLGYSFA